MKPKEFRQNPTVYKPVSYTHLSATCRAKFVVSCGSSVRAGAVTLLPVKGVEDVYKRQGEAFLTGSAERNEFALFDFVTLRLHDTQEVVKVFVRWRWRCV